LQEGLALEEVAYLRMVVELLGDDFILENKICESIKNNVFRHQHGFPLLKWVEPEDAVEVDPPMVFLNFLIFQKKFLFQAHLLAKSFQIFK